jgi:hypothetical protein
MSQGIHILRYIQGIISEAQARRLFSWIQPFAKKNSANPPKRLYQTCTCNSET